MNIVNFGVYPSNKINFYFLVSPARGHPHIFREKASNNIAWDNEHMHEHAMGMHYISRVIILLGVLLWNFIDFLFQIPLLIFLD